MAESERVETPQQLLDHVRAGRAFTVDFGKIVDEWTVLDNTAQLDLIAEAPDLHIWIDRVILADRLGEGRRPFFGDRVGVIEQLRGDRWGWEPWKITWNER